jgi:hypothetical protein
MPCLKRSIRLANKRPASVPADALKCPRYSGHLSFLIARYVPRVLSRSRDKANAMDGRGSVHRGAGEGCRPQW